MTSMSTAGSVRVRFAPSPTGSLHLGSALVAVANAAFARANDGAFVLRIDDTDQSRSREEDADELIELMRWLGVEWDEGPVRQSARGAIYRSAVDRLMGSGAAYPCFCGSTRLEELRAAQVAAGKPPRYDGRCRSLADDEVAKLVQSGAPHVLRYRVGEAENEVTFHDLVHGTTTIPTAAFGDPILVRSDGTAGYHFASVVDDIDLGITHVIRGEDHLSNTARHVLLFEALGAPFVPRFAHLPLLRTEDGRKLSKRDPLGTLDELSDEGFLPVSVRRYLAELLGCGAVDLLDAEAVEATFDLDAVKPGSAPRVDRSRLESLGREDMAHVPVGELIGEFAAARVEDVAPVVGELAAAAPSLVRLRGDLRLVLDGPGPGDLRLIMPMVLDDRAAASTAITALELCKAQLRGVIDAADGGREDGWAPQLIARCRAEAGATGLKPAQLLKPLRMAWTGTTSGPGLDLVLRAIGAREALRRVHAAIGAIDTSMVASTPTGG